MENMMRARRIKNSLLFRRVRVAVLFDMRLDMKKLKNIG